LNENRYPVVSLMPAFSVGVDRHDHVIVLGLPQRTSQRFCHANDFISVGLHPDGFAQVTFASRRPAGGIGVAHREQMPASSVLFAPQISHSTAYDYPSTTY
jgi:hypothetical protein